ncbi:MAG TPA: response regulator transcription factor [Gemmatimonadales bacterium]|nr:response regulator transcription factor [Gemmatimonadales bacterium]
MTKYPIRVMIVDDHPLVREGIRSIVAGEEGFEIVAEAGSGEEAVEVAGQLRPDVVILDLSMPGEGGLSAVARLREVAPTARSLVLSVHDHPEYVLEAVRAGAQGYIRKDTSPAELRQAIRTVHRGEAFFSSPVARQLSAAVRQETLRGEQGEKLERLTDRERQVLAGIAAGSTSKIIAQQLGLSPRTVEAYRENLMRKLAIRTVAGLTRFAVESGLVAE